MMYLEQRVNELEKEVALLKAKNTLEKTRTTGLITKAQDYMFNPSINLMSEPDLETSFSSAWDKLHIEKNYLDTISCNLSSLVSDSEISNYPDIIGSWDDETYTNEPPTDEYGFKLNDDDMITPWKIPLNFDNMDKRFLDWLNSKEIKPLFEKFKQRI